MYTVLYNLSLIGEFLQHSVAIIVIGLLVVRLADTLGSKRPFPEILSTYTLLGVMALAIAWDIVHFFIAEGREWLEALEFVIVFSMIGMLWKTVRVAVGRVPQALFLSIVALSVIYFGFDFFVLFTHITYNRGILLALTLVRTIIFILLYFFTLHYLIAVKNDYIHEQI